MGGPAQDDRPAGLRPPAPSELIKRSVVVSGHRTSISLERAFWRALQEIAGAQNRSINQVVGEVDRDRRGNLSSAVRVYVLEQLKARCGDPARAGAPRPAGPDSS